jgi:hemolysin III
MAPHGERLTFGKMQNPVRGILHGTAAMLSLVGGVALWVRSTGDLSRQLALLVFAVSLVALYAASSLYHSVPWRTVWKARMQRLDHAMIYVLVAGTYTPLALVVLHGWPRWMALGTTWGIAWIGIAQKACAPRVGDWFSITMQTVQGWCALPLLGPLAQQLPRMALVQVAVGGVLYTLGMVLFVTKRPRLWPRVFSYHELFHVFVVAGSAMHYAVMFRYVAGFGGA